MSNGEYQMPPGWATMPVTAAHSASVYSVGAGWGWSGMNGGLFGNTHSSGTGVFGFIIRQFVAESPTFSVSVESGVAAKIQFHIEITNPELIDTYGLDRVNLELAALSYKSGSIIPKIGDVWVDGVTNSTWSAPKAPVIVWNITYSLKNPDIPYIWIAEVAIKVDEVKNKGGGPSDKQPTANVDEAPWKLGPDVSIEFGTEDFVLGLGKYITTKSPSQMNAALEEGTYASLFSGSGTPELVCNSAGDPLESPPPMKIGTSTITVSRAFETLPAGMSSAINTAREEVCSNTIMLSGIIFPAYTCKMGSGTLTKKRWKKTAAWLPGQRHPLGFTYSELGWAPPAGTDEDSPAINKTRRTLPAYKYIDYYEVKVSIEQRDLGWGYALVDKGYRKLVNGKQKDITDFQSKQTHSKILENGNVADTSSGTANKNVLRLYQVLKVGTSLTSLMTLMLAVDDD